MSDPIVPDVIKIVGKKIILEKDGNQHTITDQYAIGPDIYVEELNDSGLSEVQLSFYTDKVHIANLPTHVTVTKTRVYKRNE